MDFGERHVAPTLPRALDLIRRAMAPGDTVQCHYVLSQHVISHPIGSMGMVHLPTGPTAYIYIYIVYIYIPPLVNFHATCGLNIPYMDPMGIVFRCWHSMNSRLVDDRINKNTPLQSLYIYILKNPPWFYPWWVGNKGFVVQSASG